MKRATEFDALIIKALGKMPANMVIILATVKGVRLQGQIEGTKINRLNLMQEINEVLTLVDHDGDENK